jgi:hypothetical protein
MLPTQVLPLCTMLTFFVTALSILQSGDTNGTSKADR